MISSLENGEIITVKYIRSDVTFKILEAPENVHKLYNTIQLVFMYF